MGFGIDLADEALHGPEQKPSWRESLWLEAYDARQGVGLLVYMHGRPTEGQADVVVRVLQRGGEVASREALGWRYEGGHHGNSLSLAGISYEITVPGHRIRVSGETEGLGAGCVVRRPWADLRLCLVPLDRLASL